MKSTQVPLFVTISVAVLTAVILGLVIDAGVQFWGGDGISDDITGIWAGEQDAEARLIAGAVCQPLLLLQTNLTNAHDATLAAVALAALSGSAQLAECQVFLNASAGTLPLHVTMDLDRLPPPRRLDVGTGSVGEAENPDSLSSSTLPTAPTVAGGGPAGTCIAHPRACEALFCMSDALPHVAGRCLKGGLVTGSILNEICCCMSHPVPCPRRK